MKENILSLQEFIGLWLIADSKTREKVISVLEPYKIDNNTCENTKEKA